MENQLHRETIVLTVASHLKNANPKTDHTEKLIGLDALVCGALGIDQEENPPEFVIPF